MTPVLRAGIVPAAVAPATAHVTAPNPRGPPEENGPAASLRIADPRARRMVVGASGFEPETFAL